MFQKIVSWFFRPLFRFVITRVFVQSLSLSTKKRRKRRTWRNTKELVSSQKEEEEERRETVVGTAEEDQGNQAKRKLTPVSQDGGKKIDGQNKSWGRKGKSIRKRKKGKNESRKIKTSRNYPKLSSSCSCFWVSSSTIGDLTPFLKTKVSSVWGEKDWRRRRSDRAAMIRRREEGA